MTPHVGRIGGDPDDGDARARPLDRLGHLRGRAADHHHAVDLVAADEPYGVSLRRPEAATAFFDYVSGWLSNHIRKEDGALAAFLKQRKAA